MAIKKIEMRPPDSGYTDVLYPRTSSDMVDHGATNIGAALNTHVGSTMHIPYATAHGATAKTVTVPEITALVDGIGLSFKNALQGTTSSLATLNVNQYGNKPLRNPKGVQVTSKDIIGGVIYTVRYNADNDSFILQGEGGEYGNAQSSDVLESVSFGTEQGVQQGTMPNHDNKQLNFRGEYMNGGYIEMTSMPSGYYGDGTTAMLQREPLLVPANIKAGVEMFDGGLVGDYAGEPFPVPRLNQWTIRASGADSAWTSVTYGNGRFVSVAGNGAAGRAMTSPDGINWTAHPDVIGGASSWQSVFYAKGMFIATATSGTAGTRLATSPDGVNWTHRASADDANGWSNMCYAKDMFVAVASSGTSGKRVMTSPDGINWTLRDSAADDNWRSVTYGNGMFVAVAQAGFGSRVMTSPDGITWTARTTGITDSSWQSVTYAQDKDMFVAVANSGTVRVMTSPDGITWTARTTGITDSSWRSIVYANGLFVSVANTGTDRVMSSTDGINWTTSASAASNSWNGLCYGNGLLVAVASSGTGNRVMTSTIEGYALGNAKSEHVLAGNSFSSAEGLGIEGGLRFTVKDVTNPVSALGTHLGYNKIAYGKGRFVAIANQSGTNADRIITSVDGVNWNYANYFPIVGSLESVFFLNNQFVVLNTSTNASVFFSDDGFNWVQRTIGIAGAQWRAMAYGNGVYVAVADSSSNTVTNRIATSTDGITWTGRSAPASPATPQNWYTVTFGNGLFVAMSVNSGSGIKKILTSPDGINWTYRDQPTGSNGISGGTWREVVFGNSMFVAVGDSHTLGYSFDGMSWFAPPTKPAGSTSWLGVAYGDGLFVAVGWGSTSAIKVITSTDGINWTAKPAEVVPDGYWRGIAYGNSMFTAVGNSTKTERMMTMEAMGTLKSI